MSRDRILARLRTSLASNRPWLEQVAQSAPRTPPPFVHPPADDLAVQFAAELQKLEGRAYLTANESEALAIIGRLLDERAVRSVVAWDLEAIPLPGLDGVLAERGITVLDPMVCGRTREERLQGLETAAVCLSGATCAIAESGSLVLHHGPGRPRLASLIAPTHIAVVRRTQLVRGLGEALAVLRQRHGAGLFEATNNLTIITGPSRTADIEMTLSLGIHGPPEVHVVMI